MAEQAQKEPTMEEILSSIRKIIADDDVPAEDSPDAVEATTDEIDVFDELDASSDEGAGDIIESEEDVLAAISQSMDEVSGEFDVGDEAPEASSDDIEFVVEEDDFEAFAEDDFEGVEDFAEADPFEASEEDSFELVEAEEPVLAKPEPMPEPLVEEEPPMSAQAAPLTDTATVTAAAGALGKLLTNVEFGAEAGGATTIEGLVREMMRPMLKEWLDENLPGIVEKHVEAEVRRIARMAG